MSVSALRAHFSRFFAFSALSVGLAGGLGLGCSSSSSSSDAAFSTSGVVTGALDTHCKGMTPVVVSPTSCAAPAGSDDAGAPPDDGGATSDFGETMYNASGDDDDCKYSVSYTDSPPVKLNENMSFKIVVKHLADGSAATGAVNFGDPQNLNQGVSIESFLSDTPSHVLPNTTPAMTATESPAGSGIYTISPVKFDASGRWVVRFHVFENCSDLLDDSPHGHAAFYFDVP